jgi:hypothetical protein
MTAQPLSSYVVVGVTTCLSMAAAIVTAFIVEPGSYVHDTARLRRDSGSATATRAGSKVGHDASARIAPSRGSITMTDPLGAFSRSIARRSSRSTAVCMTRSIVSTRSAPFFGGTAVRSPSASSRLFGSRSTTRRPGVPRSTLS